MSDPITVKIKTIGGRPPTATLVMDEANAKALAQYFGQTIQIVVVAPTEPPK